MRVKLTGDDEVMGRLQALDKAGTRIMRRAIKMAVQPVVIDAKNRIRPFSHTIADAISFEQKVKNKGQYHYIRIGAITDESAKTVKAKLNPLTGRVKARWHNPAKTAHLLELGTKPHRIVQGKNLVIQHPGARPHPGLIPALEENAALVEAIFTREAWKGIERELKKRARRAAKISKQASALLEQGAPT